jgi:hypothetical protein
LEGVVDAIFTKTAELVHRNLWLRLGGGKKSMFFKRIKQRASNEGTHRKSNQ